jgi:long-chain acyl-CoA synthetase
MADTYDANDHGARSVLRSQSLPALYEYAAARFKSSVAMKCRYPWGYRSISYEELGDLISYIGTGLITQGLLRGDRVALIAENSPEWGIVYAAVTAGGGIIVPLDAKLKENEIKHLLIHSEAKFLVTSMRIYQDQIEGMHLGEVSLIVIGEGDAREEAPGISLSEIMAEGKARLGGGNDDFRLAAAEIEPEDVAAICYTSGTTGQPKGAVLLHRSIVSNIEAIRLRLLFDEEDVFLCLLPLHHTLATTCNLLAPLFSGSTVLFGRSLKPRDIREDIAKEQVTILVGVPLLFEHFIAYMRARAAQVSKLKRFLFKIVTGVTAGIGRLFGKRPAGGARKRLAAMGLGSLRFCVSGAAPLRGDTEEMFRAIGLPLLQGYGMTETSPVISVNPLGKMRSGTVGPALPGVEVMIDRPNEEGIGEIVVRGPNVMREYYRNPGATEQVLRDGRFYTGDIGTIDDEEYITIVGRKKSVIVTAGGKNIYPDELEILLNQSPYILESLVVPFRDKRGNDRIGAIIVPDYDALGMTDAMREDASESRIRDIISAETKRVSSMLPEFKRIVDFQIRDEELPKTTTQKVKRHLVTWIEE